MAIELPPSFAQSPASLTRACWASSLSPEHWLALAVALLLAAAQGHEDAADQGSTSDAVDACSSLCTSLVGLLESSRCSPLVLGYSHALSAHLALSLSLPAPPALSCASYTSLDKADSAPGRAGAGTRSRHPSSRPGSSSGSRRANPAAAATTTTATAETQASSSSMNVPLIDERLASTTARSFVRAALASRSREAAELLAPLVGALLPAVITDSCTSRTRTTTGASGDKTTHDDEEQGQEEQEGERDEGASHREGAEAGEMAQACLAQIVDLLVRPLLHNRESQSHASTSTSTDAGMSAAVNEAHSAARRRRIMLSSSSALFDLAARAFALAPSPPRTLRTDQARESASEILHAFGAAQQQQQQITSTNENALAEVLLACSTIVSSATARPGGSSSTIKAEEEEERDAERRSDVAMEDDQGDVKKLARASSSKTDASLRGPALSSTALASSLDLTAAAQGEGTRTSYPTPEMSFVIDDLVLRRACDVGASSIRIAAARLGALAASSSPASTNASSSARDNKAAIAFWHDLVAALVASLALCAPPDSSLGEGPPPASTLSSAEYALVRAFALSRVPELVREMHARLDCSQEIIASGLHAFSREHQRHAVAARRHTSSSFPGVGGGGGGLGESEVTDEEHLEQRRRQESEELRKLVAAWTAHGLVAFDDAAVLCPGLMSDEIAQLHTIDDDEFELADLLKTEIMDGHRQRQAVEVLLRRVDEASASSDLAALATMTDAFAEVPDALGVLFLFVAPATLLSPIRTVLENFDLSHSAYGDASGPYESFGKLMLFVQAVVHREGLQRHVAHSLGDGGNGFLPEWILSSSCTRPLESLDQVCASTLNDWISALFGEGISDELMNTTNARVLALMAPTMCEQAILACDAGVLDLQTLRDGLSFFLQDMLKFCLPSIVGFLVRAIARTEPSPLLDTYLSIVTLFITSAEFPPLHTDLLFAQLRSGGDTLSSEVAARRIVSAVDPNQDIDKAVARLGLAARRSSRPWLSDGGKDAHDFHAALHESGVDGMALLFLRQCADDPASSAATVAYLSTPLGSGAMAWSLLDAFLQHALRVAQSAPSSAVPACSRIGKVCAAAAARAAEIDADLDPPGSLSSHVAAWADVLKQVSLDSADALKALAAAFPPQWS